MRDLRRVILGSRSFLISPVIILAMATAIVWWIPIPPELQQSPAGTLTLLDCRGREIAQLASAEARTQFPIPLERMGLWLPRITVALEDRRFVSRAGAHCRGCGG